jgi:hypothetical protein
MKQVEKYGNACSGILREGVTGKDRETGAYTQHSK